MKLSIVSTLLAAAALSLAACATDSSTHGNYNDPNSSSYYPTDTQNPSGSSFNPNSPGYNPGSTSGSSNGSGAGSTPDGGATEYGNMGHQGGGGGAGR